jgi:hypothetical protein
MSHIVKSSSVLTAQACLRTSCATVEQFNKLFPVVVAQYAAMKAPLPAAPVANLADYIVENRIDTSLNSCVAEIGKSSSINFSETRQLALQFYKFRYAMLHGGFESLAFAVAAFTGTSGDLISQAAKDALHIVRDDEKVNSGFNNALHVLSKDV